MGVGELDSTNLETLEIPEKFGLEPQRHGTFFDTLLILKESESKTVFLCISPSECSWLCSLKKLNQK